jgi:hypothetical protein
MPEKKNNSTLYIFSGLIGAFIGLIGAYLLEKSGELEGEENMFTSKKVSKIGLGAITFLYTLIGKEKGRGKINLKKRGFS